MHGLEVVNWQCGFLNDKTSSLILTERERERESERETERQTERQRDRERERERCGGAG